MNENLKKCSKCGLIKDVSEFNKNKRSKDGYRSICKDCRRDYREANKDKIAEKKKNYYEANKDKIAEKIKEYKKANKDRISEKNKNYYEENKQKLAEKMKEHQKENKEQLKEYKKNYYEENKQKIAEKMKEWRIENKQKIKVASQRRRARKKSLPNTLTAQQWNGTLNDFNHSCANCGARENLHMDHFVPLSAEDCPGTTSDNVIPLCATCNLSKNAKHPKDFFSEEKYNELSIYLLLR